MVVMSWTGFPLPHPAFVMKYCAHCAEWVHFMSNVKCGLGHAPLQGSKTNPQVQVYFSGDCLSNPVLGAGANFLLEIIGWLVPYGNLEVVFLSTAVCCSNIDRNLVLSYEFFSISNLSKCVSLSDSVVVVENCCWKLKEALMQET